MDNIVEYFKQAELALAAYANLEVGVPATRELVRNTVGMSQSQADRFVRDWRVVDQYNGEIVNDYIDEFGNPQQATILTGLSATVFEREGVRYLAVRGTAGFADLLTDLTDIALLGTPAWQLQYAALKAKVGEWLGNGTLSPGFTVSGHSLGGFLAGALLVDYPTQIGHAYLYNAPGVGGLPAALRLLLGLEAAPSLGLSKVSNLRADAMASPIAGLGIAWGSPISIAIENQSPDIVGNHSIVTLTDALALYNLFAKLDPQASVSAISGILSAASGTAANTLEATLAAAGKLFGKAYPANETTRDTLYANLYDLQGTLASTGASFSVASLVGKSADTLITAARNPDAYATRYALKELNPFAVLGADYSRFNQNGALNLYDKATGTGELTDAWLADRSAMLAWKLKLATEDKASSHSFPYSNKQAAFFDDRASSEKIYLGDAALPTQRTWYVFGSDAAEADLEGGSLGDHLYGGGGADILTGDRGNDFLEGGSGEDTYRFASGDGQDVITDTDGIGRIEVDDIPLAGGKEIKAGPGSGRAATTRSSTASTAKPTARRRSTSTTAPTSRAASSSRTSPTTGSASIWRTATGRAAASATTRCSVEKSICAGRREWQQR